MPIVADLHIHSRYSRATSARLSPASLERWARIKGIGLLGTGDCTHPRWLVELRENFVDAEPGLFSLREESRAVFDAGPARAEGLPSPGGEAVPRFVLSGEISTIYKRDGKTRKVHHLVLLPDFRAAAAFQTRLERIGNIGSDGRPILGLDSRDLLALLLDADERAMLVPAHIWTPWFSALGAQSGFDSIEECYGDLVSHIPAVETGLSSDPPMNWALSSLDRFSIISNSDAHSPDKLGREATIFDMDLSYAALEAAMRGGVAATIEFFPEEGKYHYDGHRKCGVCAGPGEAADGGAIAPNGSPAGGKLCPVCGKALTRGVMGRVLELADRPVETAHAPYQAAPFNRAGNRRPYYSLIPLREILGEILGTGPGSKKVDAAYGGLIAKAGSEFAILMEMKTGDIEKLRVQGLSGEVLAGALDRMRRGEVSISPGYDGEYGVVRVFPPGAALPETGGKGLFDEDGPAAAGTAKTGEAPISQTPSQSREGTSAPNAEGPGLHFRTVSAGEPAASRPGPAFTFDSAQEAIINYEGSRTIVIAGPGTGKTAVLAARIARLIHGGADPASILALSFTVKAATELRERIGARVPAGAGEVNAATFHSFCCALLREQAARAGLSPDFEILDESRRDAILQELEKPTGGRGGIKKTAAYIEERKRFLLLPGEREAQVPAAIAASLGELLRPPEPVPALEAQYRAYRDRLKEAGLLDYEDLIAGTVRLFRAKEPVLAAYQRRFRHIFVDEYQDINLSQYVLLRLLADGGGDDEDGPSLWVIGDPNQAIYGFRGSDKCFIDRFTLDYPGARRFELAQSFRCARAIISAAGRLTGSGLQGAEKPVALYRSEYATDKAEAEGIARAISRLIGGASFFAKDSDDAGPDSDDAGPDSDDAGPGSDDAGPDSGAGFADTAAPADCAVLIRAAPIAGPVVKALNDHGIPFDLTGDECWWDQEPFKTFVAQARESAAPEELFQREKENPGLKRLFELAGLFGGVRFLLDALACSGPGGLPEYSREGVRIMTMHASKGLEFDHVFVAGLEDGILPFTLYGKAGCRIEEERRLLYVAMTRARIGLYLSWSRSRNFRGRILQTAPSPFLAELETIIPAAARAPMPRRDDQLRLF